MSQPLVSILIPCWGCREYIGATIESALSQDYSPLEIIVGEDHGDDGTYEEALRYCDPRLRVIRHEQNYGQYGNKNKTREYANGEWIKYLDGDDLLEADAISRLMSAAQQCGEEVGVIFAQSVTVGPEGEFVSRRRKWGYEGKAQGLVVLDMVTRLESPGSMFGNVSAHLFRGRALDAIGGFPQDNAGPGDLETFLKLLTVTDVYFTEDSVCHYRVHPDNMSSRTFGLRECTDYLIMVEKLADYFSSRPGLPSHLYDESFIRNWKVWASSHNIMAAWQRQKRGIDQTYDTVKQMFHDRGLRREFEDQFRKRLLPYLFDTFSKKIRKALHYPMANPVFSRPNRRVLTAAAREKG